MTEGKRNFAVGATALVGMAMLVGVILIFTGLPGFFSGGYEIKVYMDDTHSIRTGEPVYYRGLKIGSVTDIRFTDDDHTKGITLTARIDRNYPLPTNVRLHLYKTGISSLPYLEFKSSGEYLTGESGKRIEFFPTDPQPTIELGYKGGGGGLPSGLLDAMESLGKFSDQVGPAMEEFSKLAKNINNLIAPPSEKTTPPDGTNGNGQSTPATSPLANSLANLDKALAGIAKFFGEKENQENFSKTLKDLADVAAGAQSMMDELRGVMSEFRDVAKEASKAAKAAGVTAQTTTGQVEKVSESMLTQIEKLSSLLETLHKASKKIESGKGSAGKLLNDPELYNSLTEAAKELSNLTAELRQLVSKWKKEGVNIKLK